MHSFGNEVKQDDTVGAWGVCGEKKCIQTFDVETWGKETTRKV